MATRASDQSTATSPLLPLFRMDVAMYHRLIDAGALEGCEVELLDGLLYNKESHRDDALHRFDVGTFERMVASGALDGLRIELLEGLLLEVSPHSVEHAMAIEQLTAYLATAVASLRVQLPLEGDWESVPEPDLALVERLHPRHRHPRTALLVVEVAVTSHQQDRGLKADMYAWAPVPLYWLVDVPAKTIEVRTEPGPGGYARCETYGPGAKVPSPDEGVPDLDVSWLFDDEA